MKETYLEIIPIKNLARNSPNENVEKSADIHLIKKINIANIRNIKNSIKKKKYIYLNLKKKIFFFIFCICILIAFYFLFFKIKIPNEFLNIFIVAHKDFINKLTNQSYKIICDNKTQLKNEYPLKIIETYKDNELYAKRRGYCEGSKIYYIWKKYKKRKMSSKYIGFVHYRRVFTFENNIPDLDKIFNQYDSIILKKMRININMKDQYSRAHFKCFMDEIETIIKENFTEYYQSAIKSLNGNLISFCNIFIMKKKDFLKYGEFVFGVLLEFDRRHKLKNDDDIKKFIESEIKKAGIKTNILYQCRQQGFLMERISQIFYDHYFKKPFEIGVTR